MDGYAIRYGGNTSDWPAEHTGMVFGSIDILGAGLSGMMVKNIPKAEVPKLANAIQTARRAHNEK